MGKTGKHPPLILQFIENQLRYPDAIVATEVGGFFEIWQVDNVGHAFKASQLLDTVLTRRNKSDPNSPYMTGFPSHAAHGYFKKLVDLGETVVLVEQSIRGIKADGNKNVTRAITKILSPGTVLDNLKEGQNNFFASLYIEENLVGICLIDISTGEVKLSEMNLSQAKDFLDKMNPKEILITGKSNFEFSEKQLVHNQSDKSKVTSLNSCGKLLSDLYDIKNPTSNDSYSIISLGLEFWRLGVLSLGNLLNYLAITEYNAKLLKKISKPEIYQVNQHLTIPSNGFLSLEVFEGTNKTEQNTLLSVLDKCKTAMGRRKLKQWIMTPLADIELIRQRHDKVEQIIETKSYLDELKDVYDISRISRKMIINSLMPHEITQLYQSLSIVEPIVLAENKILGAKVKKIIAQIQKNIDISLAATYTDKSEFNFFRSNLSATVEKFYNQWKNAEQKLEDHKNSLEAQIGSSNLKLVEKSDSFYLICPKGLATKLDAAGVSYDEQASNLRILDKNWETYSSSCFGHKNRYLQECDKAWTFFQQQFLISWGKELLEIASIVGEMDVLSNFASLSQERGYHRPVLLETSQAQFNLKNLRHPVVELSPKLKESFVSNDVFLGEKENTLVIYGANSAGKSTILKSVALNILMSQIGCFIAADKDSSMTVFDAILTRMSSFDSLSDGLSTFTMEMTELQIALQYATKKSVFLFDEIGRGTSVEDGEAIAYSTLVYLDKIENNCVTLFATHYHGLYEQIAVMPKLQIKHVHCYSNSQGNLVFARKLKDGIGEGSYGIEVAKSCGLPLDLIRVAERYSKNLSSVKQSRYNSSVQGTVCPICEENPAQETHHIIEQHQGKIKEISINGAIKSINHQSNLVMLCSTCHEKITRGELLVEFKKVLGTSNTLSLEITKVVK